VGGGVFVGGPVVVVKPAFPGTGPGGAPFAAEEKPRFCTLAERSPSSFAKTGVIAPEPCYDLCS